MSSPPVNSLVSPKIIVAPPLIEAFENAADRRAGRQTSGRIGLTALGAHDEFADRERLRVGARSRIGQIPGLCARLSMVFKSPKRSMLKPINRFAGLCDFFDDALGPLRFDTDDDARGNVRITASAGQRAEGQFEIFAELQTAISVRQSHRAFDQASDAFSGSIGNIVDRQNDDVVANAETAIRALEAGQFQFLWINHIVHLKSFDVVGVDMRTALDVRDGFADRAAVFDTGFSLARSRMATLWPSGTLSSSLTFPAALPSSVTAPTVEPFFKSITATPTSSWVHVAKRHVS